MPRERPEPAPPRPAPPEAAPPEAALAEPAPPEAARPDAASLVPPVFILVRPQMGENIGAAARAMWNFGLDGLRLVAPRDGWPNPRAVAMASGAACVLDAARLFASTAEAVGDCERVYATTARGRDLTKRVLTPEAAMAEMRGLARGGLRCAVLLGPERAGLENDDVARANAVVTVPVNPRFASLNLAQCALLMAYEWQRSTDAPTPPERPMTAAEPADHAAVEALARRWEEALEAVGYFFPDHRAPSMRQGLRNLWSRMPLTRADVQTLHGALRQLVRSRAG